MLPVAEMRTEEEQVAAIKSWWKENGKSLVLTVAVVLAGVFGWKAWQQKQANDAEAASIIYQNLVQAVAVSVQQGAADDVTTANHLGQQLKNDYDGSGSADNDFVDTELEDAFELDFNDSKAMKRLHKAKARRGARHRIEDHFERKALKELEDNWDYLD